MTEDRTLTPVNELADQFWEAILELNPTTATFYSDDRYAAQFNWYCQCQCGNA